MDVQNELKHYGVLGMKWGKRQAKSSTPTPGQVRRQEKREDRQIKKERRNDVKNRRRLSDKDLADKIARLEKEKKLRELTDAEINPGKKEVNDVMKSAGTKVASTLVSGAALYAVKYALTGKADMADGITKDMSYKDVRAKEAENAVKMARDMASYLAPKPGKK